MAYLDGELEPRRAAALASHLEHCTECQEVARSIRGISAQMLAFEIESAPQNLTTVVLDASKSSSQEIPAKTQETRGPRFTRWRELFAARRNWALAAGFAMVIGIAYLVGSQRASLLQPNGRAVDQIVSMNAESAPASPAPSGYKSWLQNEAGLSDQNKAALAKKRAESSLALSMAYDAPAASPSPAPESTSAPVVAPMIEQTASLSIVAKNYDEASAAIEKLAKSRGGYIEKLEGQSQSGSSRSLSASLRVPANQLDGFLADLRQLGHVESDSLTNEEVSAQYVDLQARLKVAQATERRLVDLLGARTGRLEDVLDVERELARVRSEIESMQGESALMLHQVSYATVQVQLSEEFHEKFHSDSSVGTKLRNAFVGGLQNLQDAILGVLIFFLNYGLAIVFWLVAILVPAWFLRRVFLRRRELRAS